jgi:predicted SAM-dependent methyltransferase
MEHLHPDDAAAQLQEVHRVLRPGGRYVCVTPSRVNGPHDCSAYFDDLPCPIQGGHYQATGFHLKEYTTRELVALFKDTGFVQVRGWVGARGKYLRLPSLILIAIEAILRLIPAPSRKRSKMFGIMLGNRVCATKP